MTQIQTMIDELAAAKVAMEENPQLKAQIVNLEYTRTDLESKLEMLSGDHGILHEHHLALETKLAQLEAELEAARFRELATCAKLDKLVSSFRETIDEVAPVSISVAEESSTVVEEPAAVLGEPNTIVVGIPDAMWNDETRHTPMDVVEETSQMLHQPNEVGEAAMVEGVERTAKAVDLGQTLGPAIDRFDSAILTPIVDRISDLASRAIEHTKPAKMELGTESISNPTTGDGSGSETSGSSPQPWSKPRVTEVILPQPYAGLHHTRKPDAMSWPTWVDGGGMRPWWATDEELDKLRLGSALAS